MTPAEIKRAIKLAYARGYNAGRAGRWPEGIPPIPVEMVRALAVAAKLCRDILDNELAMMSPGDEPYTTRYGEGIDAVDQVLEDVQTWMMSEVNSLKGIE